jgi:starvation-inducible outer membrane lipoprotein
MKLLLVLLCLPLAGCITIPYRVSLTYSGASASYDGKRIIVGVDGNEISNSLRGYSK